MFENVVVYLHQTFGKDNRKNVIRKITYVAPAVIRRVSMELETPILAGSVVNNSTSIKTAGQEVQSYDFSDPSSSFNQVWE